MPGSSPAGSRALGSNLPRPPTRRPPFTFVITGPVLTWLTRAGCSAFSNDCIARVNSPEQVSVWRQSNGLSTGTVAGHGRPELWIRAPPFILHCLIMRIFDAPTLLPGSLPGPILSTVGRKDFVMNEPKGPLQILIVEDSGNDAE